MARKEKNPDREMWPLEVGLFLLLRGSFLASGSGATFIFLTRSGQKPLSWGTGRARPSPSLALLWPSGQLHRSAPSDIKKVPDRSHPEITHGSLSSLP